MILFRRRSTLAQYAFLVIGLFFLYAVIDSVLADLERELFNDRGLGTIEFRKLACHNETGRFFEGIIIGNYL